MLAQRQSIGGARPLRVSRRAAMPSRRPSKQAPAGGRAATLVRRVAAEPTSDAGGAGDFVMAMSDDTMSVEDIKAALLDSLYGTERGLSARSEVRAEINELITQLEAANPTPSPTEMVAALDGCWKLVYTSNSELLAILALSKLPFVTIGDITQRIDTGTNTVENRAQISVPLSRTSVATTASFEVRSPKRLQVRFERGTIQTPELLAAIEVPDSISVMGQVVDLTAVRGLLQPVGETLNSVITTVGGLLGQAPDLSFPIRAEQASTWLLTTYLDPDTRITRGDGGSVFILVKDVSLGGYGGGYGDGALSSGAFDA